MFNADHRYKIHWELTDRCNLKCPMCPRNDIFDHCRPVQEVQNIQYFLDDVKQYFPDNFLKRLARIDFSGNFGEPCVARDFYKIVEFLVKNYSITIMVSTSGSMRNPSWWKKLGALLAGTKSWFEFHIDGLKDTNHLYRIGANWNKIMANTAAFISGGARADWHYILFKHNQHQIDDALETARKMGFYSFVVIESSRFPADGTYRYMHPDGGLRDLEKATISINCGNENAKTAILGRKDELIPGIDPLRKAIAPFAAADKIRLQKKNTNFLTTVNGITCKSANQNRFFLDASGYIAPCCWVSNHDFQRPGDMLTSISLAGKDLDNYNIRNRPIEEILQDELFTTVFSDLWESDALVTCRKKCGKNLRNVRSYIKL